MNIEVNSIIFLDIDGVLNWEHSKSCCIYDEISYLGVDNSKVKLLAKIVKETNAKIVLISTWRKYFEVGAYKQNHQMAKYLSNKLRAQGLKVYSKTIEKRWIDRADEILSWLDHNPQVKNWVILDDEWFHGYDQDKIKKHWIKTLYNFQDKSEYSGLTEELANKAIEILNGNLIGPCLQSEFVDFWNMDAMVEEEKNHMYIWK